MLKDEYQQTLQLDHIRSRSNLTALEKQSMITLHKTSFNIQHNSSIKTIFSVANTMVGSSCLVIPLVFQKTGIILSSLICLLMGYISMKTCSIQLIHFKLNEMDLSDAIIRILGYKYYYSFIISSIMLMYFASIIYFLLSANLLYDLVSLIANRFDVLLPDKNQMDYCQFSYQYSGILLFLLFSVFFLQKDLKIFIKMGSLGMFNIFCYILFLIVMSIININGNNFKTSDLKLFTDQVATTLGVFAISFFIHSIAVPIFKNNRNYNNNIRDLKLGFLLTSIVYLLIGIFGSLAIQRTIHPSISIQTSLDYFKDYMITILITFALLLQIVTSLPLVWYITRSQIFNLIYQDNLPNPDRLFIQQIICNSIFLGISLILQQVNANIQMFISLNGAVCGFWLIYVIPIKLHIQCLYGIQQNLKSKNTMIHVNSNDKLFIKGGKFHSLGTKTQSANNLLSNHSKLGYENGTTDNTDSCGAGNIMRHKNCNSMHLSIKRSLSQRSRLIVYGLVLMFGFGILVLKIIDLFTTST